MAALRLLHALGPLALAVLAVAQGGCSVGSGSGAAKGLLVLPPGCEHPQGTPFDLSPTFFAGDPVDDPAGGHNQLFIRIQRESARLENVDGLAFSITNTDEVARCLAGFVAADGTPDWDERFCDRSSGKARIRIGTGGEIVHAGLSPYRTCPNAGVLGGSSVSITGVALGDCDASDPLQAMLNPLGCPKECPDQESWIEFSAFGGISGPTATKVRTPFVVNYDETIAASAFHLSLCDSAALKSFMDRRYVAPPRLTGVLDGWFDFDLRRGQSAQAFP